MNLIARLFICSTLILQCGFLWGNKFVLHTDLEEKEANDIIFVLLSKGINAKKSDSKNGFSVIIDKNMAAKSMKVLRGHGLPHGEFTDLGKAFANDGLVSSPSQENIRYLHAVSQELEESISNIDGVMVVRANLVMSKQNTFGEEISPASAAIFIKHHPDYDMTSNISKIKQLVSNSVSGLDYSKVTVALFEAVDFDLSEVPEEKDNSLIFILVILIIAGAAYYYYTTMQKPLIPNNPISNKKGNKEDMFELINKNNPEEEKSKSEQNDVNQHIKNEV